ncbi:response regulator transcription factor [Clostridium sp. Sa3CUN1]|uniref:Heme response regulator HssR n=1 Tax=Clostridium gallinarum TaxID=2762246 RepID=A0ABR8Q3I4_9CLOT|nr:response regulator transcription factor [Clostridium gallinarum]MBD7914967.1 response regulator transcription factor [Clostridium gallinarum]
MINILIVEDEKNLRRLMEVFLKENGFEVFLAEDGEKAVEIFFEYHIDLVLCDIMMPKVNGYDLVKELRRFNYDLPIIMVTAKESFEDKKKGFLIGADDYIVKPIDLDEMLLRINALLRRAKISNDHKLVIGNVVLDYNTLTITKEKKIIELTKKEFYLLFKLLSYPKQIFTRHQLIEEIWGVDIESDERTVDVHIKRIREKLGDLEEFKIITVRGLGYKAEKMI